MVRDAVWWNRRANSEEIYRCRDQTRKPPPVASRTLNAGASQTNTPSEALD